MRQVSASYSLSLPCHLLVCCIFVHVMHPISCHHVHCICIRVRLMHPSLFPVVRFAIQRSYALRRSPFVSHCEWVLNVLGMDRGLSSGLGIPPLDHRSSFFPFGGRLVLQRLTGLPQSPFVCCSKPPSKQPKTLLSLRHALGRSITIAWAKTHPVWTLLAPSTYIKASPVQKSQTKP